MCAMFCHMHDSVKRQVLPVERNVFALPELLRYPWLVVVSFPNFCFMFSELWFCLFWFFLQSVTSLSSLTVCLSLMPYALCDCIVPLESFASFYLTSWTIYVYVAYTYNWLIFCCYFLHHINSIPHHNKKMYNV